jgi:tetratricopeptide (TPR) repeat protein/tRNA A-37 threonylcarbamoyl transferase component Bud32
VKHIDTGTHVSHYRIERKIGSGGMGAVFLARDLTLDRLVAIKFLAEQDDERSRKRLLREAQAVAALDHECIAGVFEVGTDPAGGDFIVMQYVEGETLATRLRRGRLEPGEALAIAGRVAEALVVAHRRGIIHRDLKPQNIILTPDGTPKLLDFGLATRTVPSTAEAEAVTATLSVTTHAVYGTPSYMSPEQVRNKMADARSDVFSLGCVLHECLTGRRAFTGESSAEIFGAVLHVEPPPVSSIVPELGPSHDALCARMLKKKPAERFQSASAALGAIQALADTTRLGSGQSAGITHSRVRSEWTQLSPRAKWLALAAAAVVVMAGSASAWRWYRGDVLPKPSAEAARYYAMGVEALRDGTYARARDSFTEALKYSPNYVQALSGLAQAHMELDDERGATNALLRVNALVPDRTRLAIDDRLRLEAVLASVQRSHGVAIEAYRKLTERYPKDSGAWLDLGRAKEAAEFRKEARADYEKALALDPQSPAAQVRMGMLLVQDGKRKEAVPYYDEARRLYRVAGNVEGEAEAVLRKGIVLNNIGDVDVATATLQEVVRLAGDRYLSQRVRAQFDLARVAAQKGRPDDAVAATEALVRETTEAGLHSIAANGLVDFANLFLSTDPAKADAELARAMQMAAEHGAKRTEMRAQLQRMFLRSDQGKPEEAIAMAAAPLSFYGDGRYPMLEAVAKAVVSRAKEALGEFNEAIRLSTDVLRYADEISDPALANDALQNLAGQFASVGRLPEAMAARDRSAKIYRENRQFVFLASTLVQQAETLIVLGRPQDAETPIAEVERLMADGSDTNVNRPRRLARLRALIAVTQGRLADVGKYADLARVENGAKPDITDLSARVLAEYAAAHLGRSTVPAASIALWPREAGSPESRSEVSYWVARTLQARRENARAHELVEASWAELAGRGSPELRWRLAAVANLPAPTQIGATIPPRAAADEVQKLRALWGAYDSKPYFARADLKPLLGRVQ